VTFTVSTGDSGEVIQKVCDGVWPIGIVGQLPVEDELTAVELLEDETVVVASASAPWLPDEGSALTMRQLAGLPWVMREQGSATRRVLVKALDRVGLTLQGLNVRCWVDGTSEAVAHVLGGVGLSVTSYLASRHYLESGALVRLNVPELEGRRHFYLLHHKDRQLFPAHKAFIDFCRSR
jgi:DNA-binding transcriptional LysR family regulator